MKEKEYMEKSNQGNKPSNSPIMVNAKPKAAPL